MKGSSRLLPLLAIAAALSGCMNDQQFIAANQQAAIAATESRAKFELNCQQVNSSILSSKVTDTRFGYQRTEYTIGVRGCGRQATYLTYCLDTTNCNALSDTARIGNE